MNIIPFYFLLFLSIVLASIDDQTLDDQLKDFLIVKYVMKDDIPLIKKLIVKEPSSLYILYGGKSLMFLAQSAEMVDFLFKNNLSPNEREPDTLLTPLFTVNAKAIPRLYHHGARLDERVLTRIGSLNALEFAINEYLITDCHLAFERVKALYSLGSRYRRENLILFNIFKGSENRFSILKRWEIEKDEVSSIIREPLSTDVVMDDSTTTI